MLRTHARSALALALTTVAGCSPGVFGEPGRGDGATPGGSDAGRPPRTDAAPPPPPPGDAGPLTGPIPNCRPTLPPSTGDVREDCVRRINQFRWECQQLPPLARWTEGEACADQHAEYDSTRTAHAGFSGRICTPGGSAQNECPGWRSTAEVVSGCLQGMWNEGPGEPFSEHGHYINMSSTRYRRVACGFYTTSAGRIWAVQNFSQ